MWSIGSPKKYHCGPQIHFASRFCDHVLRLQDIRRHTKQLALPTPFWLSWWGCPIHSLECRCLLQSLTKMKWSNHTVILKECLSVEAANHRVFYLERLQVGGVKPAESQSKKAPDSWRCFQGWLLAFLLDRPTRSGKGLLLRYRWVWIVESWKGPFLSNARWNEYGWIVGWMEIHPLSLSHHGTEVRKGIKSTVPLCSWFPEASVASKVGGHELLARGLVGVGEGERFRS